MSMRVLHVIRSLRPETGGTAEAVRQLTQAQIAAGDEPSIVSFDPADSGRERVTVIGERSHGYGRAPGYGPWLCAHHDEFDAVVVHGLWQYPSFATWAALRNSRKPYLVFPHGMLDVWFKRAHPLKHWKKWLYWPWAEYRVLRDAAAVCYTTEHERLRSRESFWLYRAKERILPIGIAPPPIGANVAQAAFFDAFPALRGRPFLLFLGRIHPKKGVDLLVDAFASTCGPFANPPALVIAGPTADAGGLAALQARARALHVDTHVHWLPMLTGPAKWGALFACEAFVLFSHQENFGVAVVEALACGRPVLLSAAVGIASDLLEANAALVGSDTFEGASEVLTRWQTLKVTARVELAGRAARAFAARYDVAQSAAELNRAIREIAAGQ